MKSSSFKKVKSVAEFISAIGKYQLKRGYIRFFRGHANYSTYSLKPSIYRKTYLIKNEESIINEAILRCPADFPTSMSFFEQLVKLQHYYLPTRLLDITSNALVALYFACREHKKTEGEVIIFDIPVKDVKYYSSDTVSILANIARRPYDFNLAELPSDKRGFNEDPEIGRLIYDIRKDKPSFLPIIKPQDLKRVICVRTKLDNVRIARQDGAFLLFGIKNQKSKCARVPEEWITCGNEKQRIVFSNKHVIQRELEQFGISEQMLFPELDSQTRAIVASFLFKRKYQREKRKRSKRP